MELPRNIVQIGEPDKYRKIFVEDYVLSYMKQSIQQNREMIDAYGHIRSKMVLYGKVKEEKDITYFFLYAASVLTETSERENYLTQNEKREIEELRTNFFPEYAFWAFCTLGEELPDGFYLAEGVKWRQVNGYSCFYEKNDSMLSFMLYQKKEQGQTTDICRPEEKQEELLKAAAIERRVMPTKNQQKEKPAKKLPTALQTAAMWGLIVLCIIGITAINDADKLKNWKDAVVKGFETIGEQKIPDKEGVRLPEQIVEAGSDKVVMEATPPQTQDAVSENILIIEAEKELEESDTEPVTAPAEEPEVYVIAKGDTLLSISREKYGTVEKVKEICELNQIENPDSIEIGQTILLP